MHYLVVTNLGDVCVCGETKEFKDEANGLMDLIAFFAIRLFYGSGFRICYGVCGVLFV